MENTTNTAEDSYSKLLNSIAEKNNQNEVKINSNKLINHFQFGNQASSTDAPMNKTSNNKLDQSLRISYAEMSDTLKSYKPSFTRSIENLNSLYQEKYFQEWLKLMK